MRLLVLCILLFPSFIFAATTPQYVWTANQAPWSTISTAPPVIEMKPAQLAPVGASPSALRQVLTTVLGKSLGGYVPGAGVVFRVVDLVSGLEAKRQEVAFAMQQLEQNGQPITPQTIQEWIAQDHGIDTAAAASGWNPAALTYTVNGIVYKYRFTGHYSCQNRESAQLIFFGKDMSWMTVYEKQGSCVGADSYALVSSSSAPAGFNPADHPELYDESHFSENIVDALINRDLKSFDLSMPKSAGPLIDPVVVDIEAIDPTPDDPEKDTVYDTNGRRYYVPPNIFGDTNLPITNLPSNTVNVQTDTGITTLSPQDSAPFIQSGVPPTWTIVSVNPTTGSVTYQDPGTGQTYNTTTSTSSVQNLSNNHNVYNTYNNSTQTTNIHQEISLPEVHVSGSLNKPEKATIEPVTSDRVEASKNKFFQRWNDLKLTFSGIFDVNLSGTGHLPIWHWIILGKSFTFDFNDYATELNWIGLATVLLASISAVFIVIDK